MEDAQVGEMEDAQVDEMEIRFCPSVLTVNSLVLSLVTLCMRIYIKLVVGPCNYARCSLNS
jgi:hypothetical protein